MRMLCMVLGAACILYFIAILLFVGHGTNFFIIWGVIGICLILWAKFGNEVYNKMPKALRALSLFAVIAGGILFIAIEGMIVSGFFSKGKDNLDYIIVLGAQLKENGPSYVLQMRLDAAYEYLESNPETKVIVSGGQGSDEPDTEAQGMFDYLVARGISPDRIIREAASTDTDENIRFSGQLIHIETDSVGVVTSNFHIFRAVHLAKAAGYEEVYGIPARSYPGLLMNNMLREFFGIIKDFLAGNLI